MGRLGGATDHFCLSDGTSLKLIPRVRNHLFTYGLHSNQGNIEFNKLMRRAPELLDQFDSQINTFHRVAVNGLAHEPKPVLMSSSVPRPALTAWFHGFYLNPHSLEDSAERMLEWGEPEAPSFAHFAKVTYVPLTECAAKDLKFQRMVAQMIASTYFSTSACLLIRLPSGNAQVTERMQCAIEGIRAATLNLPRSRSTNVFLMTGDLPEESLTEMGTGVTFVLHQTFDYWRYTQNAYRNAEKVVVFLDQQWKQPSEAAKTLLKDAFGQAPHFVLSIHEADYDG
jgi:hypothetical protein